MRRIIVAATLLVAFMATAQADFEDGYTAFERGYYATALREWRPLFSCVDSLVLRVLE